MFEKEPYSDNTKGVRDWYTQESHYQPEATFGSIFLLLNHPRDTGRVVYEGSIESLEFPESYLKNCMGHAAEVMVDLTGDVKNAAYSELARLACGEMSVRELTDSIMDLVTPADDYDYPWFGQAPHDSHRTIMYYLLELGLPPSELPPAD